MNSVFRPFTALTTLYFLALGITVWRGPAQAQRAPGAGGRSHREGAWATE